MTLKLVAQYANYSNFGGMNVEEFKHKAQILKQHCETIGRDYNEIIISTLPTRISRWLKLDLVSKTKALGLPVTHVEAVEIFQGERRHRFGQARLDGCRRFGVGGPQGRAGAQKQCTQPSHNVHT